MIKIVVIFLVAVLNLVVVTLGDNDDYDMHPHFSEEDEHGLKKRSTEGPETSAKYWLRNGQIALEERLKRRVNENIAKNVILFLGDGMSIPTLSATRVYMGGESEQLSFEKFPFTGLSKTYCVNKQVADSACSATAYLGGVKANLGTIGVSGAVKRDDCQAMTNSSNFVYSIAYHSQLRGKMTGLVTTSRVTHASPAGVYAHTAERDWENDRDILKSDEDPNACHDITAQLVYGKTGRNLNVIMGGGRVNFLPENSTDIDGRSKGKRIDGLNLIKEWQVLKLSSGARSPEYVATRKDLLKLNYAKTTHLLGLFSPEHCSFNLERNPDAEPSLEEMTRAAIKVLSKAKNGYFLFVEGAKIDMGHHQSMARKALNETVEFSKAIQAAVDMTDESDTLIVVTSDHAHTMSYSGYAQRGHDILGVAGKDKDNLPYTTLSYANGPGFKKDRSSNSSAMDDVNYKYPSAVPMRRETHGGDDVGVFARGPWAHLFTGVMEQNVIPSLMSFASCVGQGATACDTAKES